MSVISTGIVFFVPVILSTIFVTTFTVEVPPFSIIFFAGTHGSESTSVVVIRA